MNFIDHPHEKSIFQISVVPNKCMLGVLAVIFFKALHLSQYILLVSLYRVWNAYIEVNN
jgi:hypothetical protein